jgi:hypothetical protein
MTIPTNNVTVTIADAHSHSVAQANVPCATQLDAALSVLQAAVDNPTPFATLVATDSWTITVTAP